MTLIHEKLKRLIYGKSQSLVINRVKNFRKRAAYPRPIFLGVPPGRIRPIPNINSLILRPLQVSFHFSGVLRCAEAVSKKSYTIFGLQFYGECWSGENVNQTYDRDGNSSQCFSAVNKEFKPCNDDSDEACVGAAGANYIYKIVRPGK